MGVQNSRERVRGMHDSGRILECVRENSFIHVKLIAAFQDMQARMSLSVVNQVEKSGGILQQNES